MDILGKIRRKLSPFREVMTAADYRAAQSAPPFTAQTTRLFGQDVVFSNAEGFFHSVKEIFYDEVYRFQTDNPEPYIVDAGANIGLSVIYFKRLYPNSRIVAFEPDEAIFSMLRANIQAADYRNVDPRMSAAWTEDTELTFYSEGSLAGSTEVDFLNKGQTSRVAAERLRRFIDGQRVDFLKIDIEGGENSVLFDLEDVLPSVDRLFFEYHSVASAPQKLGQMLDLVSRAGFRYIINGPHGPHHPFVDRINHGFDLQLNVSCYRP